MAKRGQRAEPGDVIGLQSTEFDDYRWIIRVYDVDEYGNPTVWDERFIQNNEVIEHRDDSIYKERELKFPWGHIVTKFDISAWVALELSDGECWPEV